MAVIAECRAYSICSQYSLDFWKLYGVENRIESSDLNYGRQLLSGIRCAGQVVLCWCYHRLGSNKNELEPKDGLSPSFDHNDR